MIRVGINGFGRIGRTLFRAALERPDIEIVAINDLSRPDTRSHLLRFDSLRGRLPQEEVLKDGQLAFRGAPVKMFTVREPLDVPWGRHDVDVVVEATGQLTDRAGEHLKSGAKRVLVSAPAESADVTLVLGLNEEVYDPHRHFVVSNASCTVNCFGLLLTVLDREFGVRSALVANVHSVSRQQATQDSEHEDLRLARAAGVNIVPHHPGAARSFVQVRPEFAGRVKDYTLRVPVPIGSLNNVSAHLERPVTVDEVNAAVRRAAEVGPMAPYLDYADEPIVSTDVISDGASCVFDAGLTQAVGEQVQVVGWHDNEWAYSCRLADLASYLGAIDRDGAVGGATPVPLRAA